MALRAAVRPPKLGLRSEEFPAGARSGQPQAGGHGAVSLYEERAWELPTRGKRVKAEARLGSGKLRFGKMLVNGFRPRCSPGTETQLLEQRIETHEIITPWDPHRYFMLLSRRKVKHDWAWILGSDASYLMWRHHPATFGDSGSVGMPRPVTPLLLLPRAQASWREDLSLVLLEKPLNGHLERFGYTLWKAQMVI